MNEEVRMVRDDSYRGGYESYETRRRRQEEEDRRRREHERRFEERRFTGGRDWDEPRRQDRVEQERREFGSDPSRMYNEPYSEGRNRDEEWERGQERELRNPGFGPSESGWRHGSSGGVTQGGYGRESYGYGSSGQTYGRETRSMGNYGESYGTAGQPFNIGSPYGTYGGPGWGSSYGRGAGQWETREGFDRFRGGTWGAFGPHAGRGPRTYVRSDERIAEDVNDRLTEHGYIDASDIVVEVRQCEVSLIGSVDTRDQKRLAEDLTELVPGVREVHNKLKVNDRRRMGRSRESGSFWSSESSRPTMGSGVERFDIREHMEVVDADGDRIGEVKEIRGDEFLVDRPMRRDIYVPMRLVRECSGDRVMLTHAKDDLEDLHLEHPDLVGGQSKRKE
jgi:hypothetical protein